MYTTKNAYKLFIACTFGLVRSRNLLIILTVPPWKISDGMSKFISIWNIDQWIWSIVTLFFFYMFFFVLVSKIPWTKRYFVTLKPITAVFLFLIDITVNIVLDVVVLSFPGFFPLQLVKLVTSCPISISPLILGPELVFFKWYESKTKSK